MANRTANSEALLVEAANGRGPTSSATTEAQDNGKLRLNMTSSVVPVVVGFSSPKEVHEAVKVWRNVQGGLDSVQRKEIERIVLDMFKDSGYYGWSWASPTDA